MARERLGVDQATADLDDVMNRPLAQRARARGGGAGGLETPADGLLGVGANLEEERNIALTLRLRADPEAVEYPDGRFAHIDVARREGMTPKLQ